MTIVTGYYVAIGCFIVIGLCMLGAHYMPRGRCAQCAKFDNKHVNILGWPFRGICLRKFGDYSKEIELLKITNRLCEAEDLIEKTIKKEKHIRHESQGCHKFCQRKII